MSLNSKSLLYDTTQGQTLSKNYDEIGAMYHIMFVGHRVYSEPNRVLISI